MSEMSEEPLDIPLLALCAILTVLGTLGVAQVSLQVMTWLG